MQIRFGTARALCALVLFAAATGGAPAQMRPPIPLTPDQFRVAGVGKSVEIVVRVRSATRSALQGELLRRIDDGHYAAGGRIVAIFAPDDVPLVMGSRADLAPGAVVFVKGVATGRSRVDAKRLLIVTKYVRIVRS